MLNRCDVAHYFVAHATKYVGNHYTDLEKTLFKEVIWVPIKEILDFYQKNDSKNVGLIIHKRDMMALKELLNKFW